MKYSLAAGVLSAATALSAPSLNSRSPSLPEIAASGLKLGGKKTLATNRNDNVLAGQSSEAQKTTGNVWNTTNWAGADIKHSDIQGIILPTQIPSTFQVPIIGGDPNAVYGGVFWAGIDIDNGCSGSFRTGFYWLTNGKEPVVQAFSQWGNNNAVDKLNLTTYPGDELTILLHTISADSAVTSVINHSKNTSASFSYTKRPEQLCFGQAGFILQEFQYAGGVLPLANFDRIQAIGVRTRVGAQGAVDFNGATTYNIVDDGQYLATPSFEGPNALVIKYTGASNPK